LALWKEQILLLKQEINQTPGTFDKLSGIGQPEGDFCRAIENSPPLKRRTTAAGSGVLPFFSVSSVLKPFPFPRKGKTFNTENTEKESHESRFTNHKSRFTTPPPSFWQPRFYDFNVWRLKKRVEKLHYMHRNPLKRKLHEHPRDWPWSSFSFYSNLKPGLIRVDPVR
jgi:hypothetical protein